MPMRKRDVVYIFSLLLLFSFIPIIIIFFLFYRLLSFSPLEPSLCGLPTEYVLYPSIFIHLDIRDILNLSQTNRYMESAVKQHLSKIKTLDFSKRWDEPISDYQFKILHENCRNIRELNFNKCYWLEDCQLAPLLVNNVSHLEKVIFKFGKLETIELMSKCGNLKSVLLFSHGIFYEKYLLDLYIFLCLNNLNLDHIFITNGQNFETMICRKICME